MPPIRDLLPYLERIWDSRQLSNHGQVHEEFEQALCEYLGVKYICLFANGTLALMIALKVLNLKGEVITTPFTSPATAQAIYWNNLTPVFADINESDLNINISAIESAITENTCAILPVHIFGIPCDIEAIHKTALNHNLNVVYDAAHCFGVEVDNQSICNFGDLSVLSFHATKVFNCIEGGAIVCHDEKTKKQIDALKNTGFDIDYNLTGYGINAKMNEMQAAFGLCQLKYIDSVIGNRKAADAFYRKLLKDVKGIKLPGNVNSTKLNYSYFPILINPEEFGCNRDEVHDHLKRKNIITRKYFFPLVCDYAEFSIYKTVDLPVAQAMAKNILCIPLFPDISIEQIETVVASIKQLQG